MFSEAKIYFVEPMDVGEYSLCIAILYILPLHQFDRKCQIEEDLSL